MSLDSGMDFQEDIFSSIIRWSIDYRSMFSIGSLYIINLYDFESQEEDGCWKWKKPPPRSKKRVSENCSQDRQQEGKVQAVRKAQNNSLKEMVLKGLTMLTKMVCYHAYDIFSFESFDYFTFI